MPRYSTDNNECPPRTRMTVLSLVGIAQQFIVIRTVASPKFYRLCSVTIYFGGLGVKNARALSLSTVT